MKTKMIIKWTTALLAMLSMQMACASIIIPMYLVTAKGEGKRIGSIKAEDGICGILLTPSLHDLPPGIHGFHVHEIPDCGKRGMAAGGHLDPGKTGKHEGPYSQEGHLGDLPVLIVDKDGRATVPTLAPNFKLEELSGHALVIHADGDNYSDKPELLGGGGARIACGVIG